MKEWKPAKLVDEVAGHGELNGRVDVGGHGDVGLAKGCEDESGMGERKKES